MSAFLTDLYQAILEFGSFMNVLSSSSWAFPVVAIMAFSVLLLILVDNH